MNFSVNQYFYYWCVKHHFCYALYWVFMECLAHQSYQLLSKSSKNHSLLVLLCLFPSFNQSFGNTLQILTKYNYVMTVFSCFSGKTPSLYRHDLLGLHSKQSDRLTISMNAMHKIPSKFVPKKFAMTSKVRKL